MRPFKMFFGIAIAAILFFFVARVLIFAFIIAAIMSIVYAVFRRIRDFITYDRYGEYYIPKYQTARVRGYGYNDVEPLINERYARSQEPLRQIRFIDAV